MKMKMHTNSSAPEHTGRKSTDRYYQLPQWGIKSGIFKSLTRTESSLYIFFVSKADKYTRMTPAYPVCDLAERCKINRKHVRPAILALAAHKLIRPTDKGIRVQVIVLFDPPPDLYTQQDQIRRANAPTAEEDSLNGLHLKAKVLNRRAPSETGSNLSQIPGHFVPDIGAFKDSTGDKLGHSRDLESTSIIDSGEDYEPGTDTEELGHGNHKTINGSAAEDGLQSPF